MKRRGSIRRLFNVTSAGWSGIAVICRWVGESVTKGGILPDFLFDKSEDWFLEC